MIRINNIDHFVTGDGPGLRYTIYLQGCPMQCLYCHNPETRSFKGGFVMKEEDLIDDILQAAKYLRSSGGGITFSGGEPLAQARQLVPLCKKLHHYDLDVLIDTSGCYFNSNSRELISNYIDRVVLDIKTFNEDTYRQLTGHSLIPTLQLAKYLSMIKKSVTVRYVLVSGLTDEQKSIKHLATFLSNLNNIKEVQVIPFHRLAIPKYKALNITYPLKDTPVPTAQKIQETKQMFINKGLIAK